MIKSIKLIVFVLAIGCGQDVKNETSLKATSKDSLYNNPITTDSIAAVIKETEKKQPIINLSIKYNDAGKDNQIGFISGISTHQKVRIFPNRKIRKALEINKIEGIYGINQFFMDHDLTTGYVHEYTTNFFRKLPDAGFVLKFKRSENQINVGTISYIRKMDLTDLDKLGENIAFCRQWKLSEINIVQGKIFMNKCKYSSNCVCPQVKNTSSNPYSPEIPIWSSLNKSGFIALSDLDQLGSIDGGTVVIIWEDNDSHEILFQDLHGSITDIITAAFNIRDKYKTDPTIGIYDSGSYARKFKADVNKVIDFKNVNSNTGAVDIAGAGYGYIYKE